MRKASYPTARTQEYWSGSGFSVNRLIVARCAGCHGTDGNGGELGPNIATRVPLRSDDELAAKIRLLRGQGMDPQRRYWFPVIGYNYRMTNICAAIGSAQMEAIEAVIAMKQAVAGTGRAAKAEVQQMVKRLLQLPGLPGKDAADALLANASGVGLDPALVRAELDHNDLWWDRLSDEGELVAFASSLLAGTAGAAGQPRQALELPGRAVAHRHCHPDRQRRNHPPRLATIFGQTATQSGGPTTFTLDPTTNFASNETCTVTIVAANVTDQDADDPPDAMSNTHRRFSVDGIE